MHINLLDKFKHMSFVPKSRVSLCFVAVALLFLLFFVVVVAAS